MDSEQKKRRADAERVRRANMSEEDRARVEARKWERRLWDYYRMTPEQYEELLARQGGVCGICKKNSSYSSSHARLGVDHDHACCPEKKTCGQCVSGLVCLSCNQKIGFYETYRSEVSEWMKRTVVTVDLDSTLCDTRHRHHMIDRVNGTDWNAYSEACAEDGLIEATAMLVRTLSVNHLVHYVSGRTESARKQTEAWLSRHGLPMDGLWLDPGDHFADHGSHSAYKVRSVRQVEVATGKRVVLHLDDWAEVKHALEEDGIPTICVRTPSEVEDLVNPRFDNASLA